MITVVGSRNSKFNHLDNIRQPFYHEDDPNNYYYNEYCGHLYNLEHISDHKNFVGLEHYRRTFAKDGKPMTEEDINSILNEYDIIVKAKHGPFDKHNNLTVLSGCSRHHINYIKDAIYTLNKFPNLIEQAKDTTHYGCNMFITRPDKYKEMVEEAKYYIDNMLEYCKQQSMISYFCETIITPYLISKYNDKIYIGDVI